MYSTSTFQGSQICEAESQDGATSDRNAPSQTYRVKSDLPRQSTSSALDMPGFGEVQAPRLLPAARVCTCTGQFLRMHLLLPNYSVPTGVGLGTPGKL